MVQRQREYDDDLRHLASMRAFLREVCQENWQGEPADENLIVRLELALTEATKTLFRAWLSYSALDSDDSAEPQVLATAVAGTSASRSAGISVRMAPGR